jgi:hypothetical protein
MELTEKNSERPNHEIASGQSKMDPRSLWHRFFYDRLSAQWLEPQGCLLSTYWAIKERASECGSTANGCSLLLNDFWFPRLPFVGIFDKLQTRHEAASCTRF